MIFIRLLGTLHIYYNLIYFSTILSILLRNFYEYLDSCKYGLVDNLMPLRKIEMHSRFLEYFQAFIKTHSFGRFFEVLGES